MKGSLIVKRVWERDERDPANEGGRLTEEEAQKKDLRPPRFKVEMNHNQSVDPSTRVIVTGKVYSDSQFQREYGQVKEPNPNYFHSATFSLTQQHELGHTSLLVTQDRVFEEVALLNRNLDDTRIQRVPELAFNLSGSPWENSITLETEGQSTRFQRDQGSEGFRSIVIPKFRYQFPLFEYFKVQLTYGQRISFYDAEVPELPVNETFSKSLELVEVEVNTTLTRIWQLQGGTFSRFKHLLTPRLIFDSVADVNQDRSIAINFDGADSLPGRRLIIFRLDNVLLAVTINFACYNHPC